MKSKLMKILGIFIIMLAILSFRIVYAEDNFEIKASEVEYSDIYKKWLELSDEERANTIEPRKYDVITNTNNSYYLKSMNNVFKAQELVKASIPTKYSLLDYIPENLKIRDQMETKACWAFSTIGVLESHLGLRDYNASLPVTEYDFSERHMDYGITRSAFLNNQINPYGYNRKISDGGNFWMALTYLTNGMGAVNESDLPFENNENNIDISQIQNKEVQTTIYDTKEFETVEPGQLSSLSEDERNQLMQSIKEHVVNYGGVYANVHGADIYGEDNYNNMTGAVYCKSLATAPIDHSVVIIGWDDNYSRDNFNEAQKPENDGAWLVKNSWGEKMTQDVLEFKQQIFDQNKEACESNGWFTADQIPMSVVLENLYRIFGEEKVTISQDEKTAYVEVGIDGYMYFSYEDCNIYSALGGIEKATASKDYDNIYQNDVLGPQGNMAIQGQGTLYLANVFDRDSSIQEVLDKISIFSYQGYQYKVFVNPNNDSKASEDLMEVELKEGGDIATVDAGYHVLELANPIKLTGDKFVVVLQMVNAGDTKMVALERKEEGTNWATAEVNPGESFIALENAYASNSWTDLATWQYENLRGNLCIKAYTNLQEGVELSQIYIDKEPTKTEYNAGENFDSTGMKVFARYSDGSVREITDYEIIGGENLAPNTTSVTISYEENGITKTTTQEITVKEEQEEPITLSEIYIDKAPTKTEYEEGEDFDNSGMRVMARYSDNSTKEITNYQIIGGDNLKEGTTSVTISYEENGVTKTTTQEITVNKKEEGTVVLTEIYIQQSPTKVVYQQGENFDSTGMKVMARYSDGSTKEITDYDIIGGNSLTSAVTSITISYSENGVTKTTTQEITVKEDQEEQVVVLTEIYIQNEPNKTEYEEGENFDTTGMKVIAKYSDGSTKEITDYEVVDGNNLTPDKNSVTIRYTDGGVIRSTTQEITVNEKQIDPDPFPPDTSRDPVLSNFDKAKARITETKLYFSSSDLSQARGEITIRVEGIELGDEIYTQYLHSYYLSGKKGIVTGIGDEEWKSVTIERENDGTYSMNINVKTEDLNNYNEIIESDNLYLYIKEVASLDDKSVFQVGSLDVENDSEPECYVDGEYVGGIDDVLNYNKNDGNNNNNNNNNNGGDNTTATGKLPYAGRAIIIIISVLAIGASGVFAYHRYKYIDK